MPDVATVGQPAPTLDQAAQLGLRAVNDLGNLQLGAAASSNLLFVLVLPFVAWALGYATLLRLVIPRLGRAAELGFTDLVAHWPRPSEPYAGDEGVLERVASEVLPRWR